MSKKALLMILDGWGIGDQGKDDVIFNTPSFRQAVKTLVCPTDRWVTLK